MVEWKRITNYIHRNSKSKIGIQLGHAGRKGSINVPSIGNNLPLEKNGWDLISASAIPFAAGMATPKEMTVSDMAKVISEFVNATINAHEAEFDMIELQAHHGFLLASFLSPLTNTRTDEFGGTIHNRVKFPLQVFLAIREVFPEDKPISVRVSASDWAKNGITEAEILFICESFKQAGADIINVSTGNTVAHQQPQVGRMWQTPFSDLVRNSVHIPTITTGYIQDIDQINTILLNGRADLVALGRPLLLDANFVRHAQAYEQFKPTDIPNQYVAGVSHLYPLHASGRKTIEGMKKSLKPESHKKKS